MAQPSRYEWDRDNDGGAEFEPVYSPFPANHSLITCLNGISVRVETHPRQKDQVYLNPKP